MRPRLRRIWHCRCRLLSGTLTPRGVQPLPCSGFSFFMDNATKDTVNQIVVVGGGSAGWITAGLIAADYAGQADQSGQAVRVTLIESPRVKTIGVGEPQ